MPCTGFAHVAFLGALEQAGDLTKSVCAFGMGRCGYDFVQRRWLRLTHTYLTHQRVSFLDGEIEIEVEIDEGAGLYRYRSPQWCSRILTRPLSEIALQAFCVDTWLRDLGEWIGIEKRALTGQARILTTSGTLEIFVSVTRPTLRQCSSPDGCIPLCLKRYRWRLPTLHGGDRA